MNCRYIDLIQNVEMIPKMDEQIFFYRSKLLILLNVFNAI